MAVAWPRDAATGPVFHDFCETELKYAPHFAALVSSMIAPLNFPRTESIDRLSSGCLPTSGGASSFCVNGAPVATFHPSASLVLACNDISQEEGYRVPYDVGEVLFHLLP